MYTYVYSTFLRENYHFMYTTILHVFSHVFLNSHTTVATAVQNRFFRPTVNEHYDNKNLNVKWNGQKSLSEEFYFLSRHTCLLNHICQMLTISVNSTPTYVNKMFNTENNGIKSKNYLQMRKRKTFLIVFYINCNNVVVVVFCDRLLGRNYIEKKT